MIQGYRVSGLVNNSANVTAKACIVNNDCLVGQNCSVEGVCVGNGTKVECSSSSDCWSGKVCNNKFCTINNDNSIRIHNCSELQSMNNDLSANYTLDNDIDCTGFNFESISMSPDLSISFSGNFNGNNHKIYNLTIFNSIDNGRIGLFGVVSGSTISNVCLVNVNITGGLAQVGALVGSGDSVTISNCSVTGDIHTRGSAGGIIGSFSGTISNSYSRANITGTYYSYVGGLVGYSYPSPTIVLDSYSTGKVFAYSSPIGGLIGSTYSQVSNSYYDSQTSGQNDTGKGEGKITAQMKLQSTFVNWDFNNIWAINPNINDGYPYLKDNPVV